ncbi:hypothetical protein BH23ACT5_BH23ACT5_17860 [soil metagenome]
MSEQLSAAAQAMGIPEALVERSARAKADATGQTYEAVLAAWAGGESVETEQAETPAPPAAPPAADEATEDMAAPPGAEVPAAATPPAPAATSAQVEPIGPPPVPERVSPEEALEYPVVVTVPTAAITERTGFAIPTWLSALLLIVPAFGLIYLSAAAGAECGDRTELRVDRVTGLAENCDGTPFEGRGAPGGSTDVLAVGAEVYSSCAGCHGTEGQGAGAFPALGGVLSTFGSCDDHIEWVTLGSSGFLAAGRDTYGDNNQQVDAGMPGFGGSLTAEQLAAVVAYERVRFGGGSQDEALVDCGLAEDADPDADAEPAPEVEEPSGEESG